MSSKILSRGKIMVVDDEEIMRMSLQAWLEEDGFNVTTARDGIEALRLIEEEQFDAAMVDLKMPGIDGIQVLEEIKKHQSSLPVLIMTAYASVDTAVTAMKKGAYDYITKPFNPEEITMTLHKLISHQDLIKENIYLRLQLKKQYEHHNVIAKSHKMKSILDLVDIIANSRSTILIQGESGTGKELIARAIHYSSGRQSMPFVTVACTALVDTLLEDELFGHEKGAYTDARETKKGKFEMADGGTLLLDEIGDISPRMQAALLRVLQEREFTRVGGNQFLKVDVRVLATTNKDIVQAVEEKTFREDLYYRLNVINIQVPPLRERMEDIPLLMEHFIDKYNIENNKKVEGISEPALQVLMNYRWPGNVRELEHVIERAVIVNQSGLILPSDLPPELIAKQEHLEETGPELSLQEMEKQHISRVLEHNDWNIQRSAAILQIDRSTLYSKIKRYQLQLPDARG
ncbi:MAG: sigma-54-dependent Fis family transcriptional regulator [Deltaproteobacteria bacterium]|nr:sigma-54-dependent Fis family transcriptional regulator [Deltaproteobacteria bacterium]MBW2307269.1 sigma-54-dependent Fis family transcriptional regulator [Deltaproteobacteria bacterium]